MTYVAIAQTFFNPAIGRRAIAKERPWLNISETWAGKYEADDLKTLPIISIQVFASSGGLPDLMNQKNQMLSWPQPLRLQLKLISKVTITYYKI